MNNYLLEKGTHGKQLNFFYELMNPAAQFPFCYFMAACLVYYWNMVPKIWQHILQFILKNDPCHFKDDSKLVYTTAHKYTIYWGLSYPKETPWKATKTYNLQLHNFGFNQISLNITVEISINKCVLFVSWGTIAIYQKIQIQVFHKNILNSLIRKIKQIEMFIKKFHRWRIPAQPITKRSWAWWEASSWRSLTIHGNGGKFETPGDKWVMCPTPLWPPSKGSDHPHCHPHPLLQWVTPITHTCLHPHKQLNGFKKREEVEKVNSDISEKNEKTQSL